MNTVAYQRAFERIRSEYLEMPGMQLTPDQVQRLSGVDVRICGLVLEDLVRSHFLHKTADGSYVRGAGDDPARDRA